MEKEEIFAHIDHTVLKAVTVWADVEKICLECEKYKMASVCIPPSFVARAKKAFPHISVCTVIGFPLGYMTTAAKIAETENALANGADEIDMVINVGAAKSGEFEKITAEIAAIKKCCASYGNKILKVIVEACYLSEAEKISICHCVTEAEADFIKTSTGFGDGGATLEDVRLFKKHIGSGVKIKAAGGIRTRQAMEEFLAAGCERLGCSAAMTLV